MYVIEKHITMKNYKPKLYPLEDMEVGDSILITDMTKRGSVAALGWRLAPKKFATRKTSEGFRLWRTE
jgi:phage gp29-like protein